MNPETIQQKTGSHGTERFCKGLACCDEKSVGLTNMSSALTRKNRGRKS